MISYDLVQHSKSPMISNKGVITDNIEKNIRKIGWHADIWKLAMTLKKEIIGQHSVGLYIGDIYICVIFISHRVIYPSACEDQAKM